MQMLKIALSLRSATAIAIALSLAPSLRGSAQLTPANPPGARSTTSAPKPVVDSPTGAPAARTAAGVQVETVSGAAEIALAEHLAANNITFYGAYWCSHCKEQKALFGAVAASKLPYVECAADGENSQRQLCKDKNVQMFPTWSIKGKFLPGTRNLKELAELTNYKGPMNFKYYKKS